MKRNAFLSVVMVMLLSVVTLSAYAQTESQAPQSKKIYLKSYHETYVKTDKDNGNQLCSTSSKAGEWEVFTLIDLGDGKVNIKAFNNKYVGIDPKTGKLSAKSILAQDWETFTLVPVSENWVALKANNGKFVTSDKNAKFILVANRDGVKEWESFMVIDIK